MNIGIISGRKRKTKAKTLYFKDENLNIISLYLKDKNNEKKLEKIRKKLVSKGCSLIFKENSIKNEKDIKIYDKIEKEYYFKCFFDIYKNYLEQLKLKEHKLRVLLIDKNGYTLKGEIIKDLCFNTFCLSLITDDIITAESIKESLFEENGIFLKIKDNTDIISEDIAFNLDDKTFKIRGKVFINTVDFCDIPLKDYDISVCDKIHIAQNLGFKLEFNKTEGNKSFFELKKAIKA